MTCEIMRCPYCKTYIPIKKIMLASLKIYTAASGYRCESCEKRIYPRLKRNRFASLIIFFVCLIIVILSFGILRRYGQVYLSSILFYVLFLGTLVLYNFVLIYFVYSEIGTPEKR